MKLAESILSQPNGAIWQTICGTTCQAHGGGGIHEDYFLPWHRMYLFYFEDIIRGVLNDDDFSLPYWNYSASDPGIHGVIPPEFTKKNDATFGSLYQQNRNTGVNGGQPIDSGELDDPLSLESLSQCTYSPNGAEEGFCMKLDNGLHGNVHVEVGDETNMGTVPNAAGDPIFWLHHCNIDRLWASWNAASREKSGDRPKLCFC